MPEPDASGKDFFDGAGNASTRAGIVKGIAPQPVS